MNRRSFLSGAAMAAASIPLQALTARAQDPERRGGVRRGHAAGYGPLFPKRDGTTGLNLLALPRGFRYLTFGWSGDPLDSGRATPGAHDGMAAFAIGRKRVCLVRNHEVGLRTPFSGNAYDLQAGGGTVNLEFDVARGEFIRAQESLSGTIRNCPGGPTPWGTWLTCEETTEFTTVPHGYVFEVPLDGSADAIPLRDMRRFSHEAVAVDPVTGYIYETEDAGNSSGFYRFVPNVPRKLAAGGVDLIRFGGHLPKGGYDVHNGGNEKPTASSAVHG